jgi:hypothetical protein
MSYFPTDARFTGAPGGTTFTRAPGLEVDQPMRSPGSQSSPANNLNPFQKGGRRRG